MKLPAVLIALILITGLAGACYAQAAGGAGMGPGGTAVGPPAVPGAVFTPAGQVPTNIGGGLTPGPVVAPAPSVQVSPYGIPAAAGAGPTTVIPARPNVLPGQPGYVNPGQAGYMGPGVPVTTPYGTTTGYFTTTGGLTLAGCPLPGQTVESMTNPAGAGAGPGTAPAVAVDDTSVYVVSGTQLMKFNKNSMQLVASTDLNAAAASTTASAAGMTPGLPPLTAPAETGAGPAAGTPPQIGSTMPRPEVQAMINNLQSLAPPQMEQTYLQEMYQAHLGTIAWSRLAASRAQNRNLRQFAKKAASEESAINGKFASWARSWYNSSPPGTLMPIDQNQLSHLQSLSGKDFDTAYINAMITALSEAIDLSRPVAQNAVHPELRNVASNMIRAHTRERQTLQNLLSSSYYNVRYK